ncbi:TPA_asm: hypothetical protein GEV19_02950 [Listeria monocytogenes]|nr:hypothetical protein [Listeria monocytogenes]
MADPYQRRSLEQNRMIHALIRDIVKHTFNNFERENPRSFRNDCEIVKKTMKQLFAAESYLPKDFSTSNLTVQQARDFISCILEFCFQFDIPLSRAGSEMTDDLNRYLFLCIKYRKCAVTGRRGEIHHINAIGMGRDRKHYDHTQSLLICLSREMHVLAHKIGWEAFKNKYHIDGIKLNADTVRKLNI